MIAEAEYQGREGGEMMHRLNASFETFIGVTEELKLAYDRLRERADAMDLKLKDANRSLSEKVMELDGLTERLNDLIQGMPSAVVAVDEGNRITHFNRKAERMLGLDAGQVKGRRLEEVDELTEVLLLSGGGESGEERTVHTPGGRRLVVASQLAALSDALGRPEGRIEILTDLTETDRLRREVHRLDTLAALGEMAAAVAHQIRNPLNGVEGFASLLNRRLDGEGGCEDTRRFAANIVHGVREVNAVINGMLMLTKSDPLKRHAVDLDALLRETAGDLKRAREDARIELDLKLKGRSIPADGLKLKQVFLNLGHNALEALVPGRPGRVRFRTRWTRAGAEVRVADSGRGIGAQTAGRIFEPFYTDRERGTGLGLCVAAKIVTLHGGSIRFRSLPGVGTVFKILLGHEAPGGNHD